MTVAVLAVLMYRLNNTEPAAASNPARLSSALAALFPGRVSAAELRTPVSAQLLTQEEWQSVRHCHDSRIADFAAGRLCARRALQEFGIERFSLLPAADRQALWPLSFVGSITHTEGYSAAVVGSVSDVRSVGLDSEPIGAVQADIWARICSPGELERLRGLHPERRALGATLTFVAKEAFFKCQYPLVRERLEFDAILVEADHVQRDVGRFHIRPRRPIRLQALMADAGGGGLAWEGRYRCHDGYVTAGIALLASSA